jgi:hypothetical protein
MKTGSCNQAPTAGTEINRGIRQPSQSTGTNSNASDIIEPPSGIQEVITGFSSKSSYQTGRRHNDVGRQQRIWFCVESWVLSKR